MLCLDGHRCAIAQVGAATRSASEDAVRAFLVSLIQSDGVRTREARYADAFIDLNGDGVDEVVAYLDAPGWCGTGGCTTLVLKRAGNSYVIVGQLPATRPPIRALGERTHGWRILTAWISGPIAKAYEGRYLFDSKRYSASRLRKDAAPEGKVIISGEDVKNAKPLFVEGSNR